MERLLEEKAIPYSVWMHNLLNSASFAACLIVKLFHKAIQTLCFHFEATLRA